MLSCKQIVVERDAFMFHILHGEYIALSLQTEQVITRYISGTLGIRKLDTGPTPLRSTLTQIQIPRSAMSYPADPVNPFPETPLIHGYSYHSVLPESVASEEGDVKEPWIMGIDEAGRGRKYSTSSPNTSGL